MVSAKSTVALMLGAIFVTTASAGVIGSYTFDDITGGTQFVPGARDDATNVVAGAGLSDLGINPAIAFAGSNNVPPTGAGTGDGFGFGGNLGEQVMFWHRAAGGVGSLWGGSNDSRTPLANAPMSITVSADPGFDVIVEGILIESVNSPAAINNIQVDGAPHGADFTSSSSGGIYKQNLVQLDAPVTVSGGTSITFTVLWNSGGFDQQHKLNFIDVNGSVIPEPATALLIAVGVLALRRRS
jgi:hypothetical protein